ncbi:thioredoxin family protein [Pontiellaceae bacterium B12219]|nr:thioredoxin family protein [Pontiellaceae bacterium B12219]
MKKTHSFFAAALLLTGVVHAAQIDGVTPGEFTMDLEAARKVAAEKKLPILLDFSGSDWCGWCQLMDSNVFAQAEWKNYAASNLVMVLIDFPQDQSLVPEKYAARNEALSAAYGVEGFPTFVLLDDDGETELGRLSAGQDKTPASFQAEVEALGRNRAAVLAAFAAGLSAEDKATFETLTATLAEKKAELEQVETALAAAQIRADELSEEIGAANTELKEFRIGLSGPEQLAEYTALKTQFETEMAAFSEWIATQPEENPENMTKFETMRSSLMALAAQLEAF